MLIKMASKTLLNRGWKFGAVLAHRFYLILPMSLAMTWKRVSPPLNGPWLVAALLLVSVVGVLAPLYLLQIGIGRCDPYIVVVMMAALLSRLKH